MSSLREGVPRNEGFLCLPLGKVFIGTKSFFSVNTTRMTIITTKFVIHFAKG